MYKNIISLLIYWSLLHFGLFLPADLYAQISEGGEPASFQYQNYLRNYRKVISIPVDFCVEDLKTVDAWRVSQGAPLKVATFIDTDLDIMESGQHILLPDGKEIQQLHIRAEGATALLLNYNEFYIPEGGRLFIYNTDKSQLIGAFTHQTNPGTKEYATEFITGDEIILEYEVSPSGEKPRIKIKGIGYGYNHLYITKSSTGPGTSSSCMIGINCEEGDEWQTQKNGVCHTIQKIGKDAYICSGALVNNTKEDLKPYILSANHCSEDDSQQPASAEDYNAWIFYFHFEQEGCDRQSKAYPYVTIVGCKKVASTPLDGGSDGMLLLLNQQIPEDYNVYYNGWDRSNTGALSGVGIHHPNGDYMKISTFTNPAKASTWRGDDNTVGARQAHWNVIFTETVNGRSVTEGGSSGSPLFNQDKLIVGTLTGGSSYCNQPYGTNLYGKLFYHWDQYSNDESGRMNLYLDPIKSGVTTLKGRYASGNNPVPTYMEQIQNDSNSGITATLSDNQIQITSTDPVNSVEIIASDGRLIIKKAKPENNLYTGYLPSGVYFIRIYTANGIKTVKVIKN